MASRHPFSHRRPLYARQKSLFLILVVLLVLGLPPLALSQICLRSGDVNDDGNLSPADALLTFQEFLGIANPRLDDCQKERANVDEPTSSGITPADALCIFKHFLGLSSCLSTDSFVVIEDDSPGFENSSFELIAVDKATGDAMGPLVSKNSSGETLSVIGAFFVAGSGEATLIESDFSGLPKSLINSSEQRRYDFSNYTDTTVDVAIINISSTGDESVVDVITVPFDRQQILDVFANLDFSSTLTFTQVFTKQLSTDTVSKLVWTQVLIGAASCALIEFNPLFGFTCGRALITSVTAFSEDPVKKLSLIQMVYFHAVAYLNWKIHQLY